MLSSSLSILVTFDDAYSLRTVTSFQTSFCPSRIVLTFLSNISIISFFRLFRVDSNNDLTTDSIRDDKFLFALAC